LDFGCGPGWLSICFLNLFFFIFKKLFQSLKIAS
jgi:hypothetical protein